MPLKVISAAGSLNDRAGASQAYDMPLASFSSIPKDNHLDTLCTKAVLG